MNNTSRTIVVVIVVIVLVWVAYLIGQSSNNQPQTVATSTSSNNTSAQSVTQPSSAVQSQQQSQAPTPQPVYYTPMTFSAAVEAQRSSFVNGCESAGTTANTWGKCNCNFDYLINNYGLVWLINEEAYINVNGAASPEYRSEALAAYKYCSAYSN
jgi:hypothetical protein